MSVNTMKNDTEKKIVSISSKRQITIPQKFFTTLGFSTEAECIIHGNELILRPMKNISGGEFAEQILEELIDQGLNGKALLSAFKDKQAQIRPAIEKMLSEAEDVAAKKAEYSSYDDIFGED